MKPVDNSPTRQKFCRVDGEVTLTRQKFCRVDGEMTLTRQKFCRVSVVLWISPRGSVVGGG